MINATGPEALRVPLRGPFGSPAQHTRDYNRVILISGGIGATPFTSICKDWYHRKTYTTFSDTQISKNQGYLDVNFRKNEFLSRFNVAVEKLYNFEENGTPMDPALKVENAKTLASRLSLSLQRSFEAVSSTKSEAGDVNIAVATEDDFYP